MFIFYFTGFVIASSMCSNINKICELSAQWHNITQKLTLLFEKMLKQQEKKSFNNSTDDNFINLTIKVFKDKSNDNSLYYNGSLIEYLEFIHNNTIKFLQSLLTKSYDRSFRRKLQTIAKSYHKTFRKYTDRIQRNLRHKTSLRSKNKILIISNIMKKSTDLVHRLVWGAFTHTKAEKKFNEIERISLENDLHILRITNEDRACKMFNICPPKFGFKYFALKIADLLLKVQDTSKLQHLWSSWLEVIKKTNFGGLLSTSVKLQIRINMRELQLTDNIQEIKRKLEGLKMYAETGKRLKVVPDIPYLNERVRAYEGFVDSMNEVLTGTEENWKVWNNLEAAIKKYFADQVKTTTDSEAEAFLKNMIDSVAAAPEPIRERFKNRLKVLTVPPLTDYLPLKIHN